MSKQVSIKEFDSYIKKMTKELHLDEIEKKELEEEWKQHLYDHYDSLRRDDVDEQEAIQIVIEQFGPVEMLKEEVNQTYPSSMKNHLFKEVLIGIICIVASVIGPGLLIGAYFQPYFIVAPIQALVVAYFIHRFIIKKQTFWMFSIIGFIPIYVIFLQFLSQMYGTPLTLELYLSEIFSLDWNRLAGINGLYEYPTLHMFWYFILLAQLVSGNNYVSVWKRMCNATFHYWAMLLVALVIAKFQTSAEWAVISMNVILLYTFLQEMISNQQFIQWKETIHRLVAKTREGEN
ncbi:permease prefix domain 1-containing protein [Oceanobacillus salinisoli]|uniref:permease prefix domain 1-containing protein n=1 Tax=Oceanobacillus salinisoli TaxID=2678611 RepID=UPI0012E1125D|nr:permease prefix domain 1-containing protein [Oceanobacillus salinisoli]